MEVIDTIFGGVEFKTFFFTLFFFFFEGWRRRLHAPICDGILLTKMARVICIDFDPQLARVAPTRNDVAGTPVDHTLSRRRERN